MSESRRRQSLHEAAHKLDGRTAGSQTRVRRSFNEAAHKLGHWQLTPAAVRERPRPPGTTENERDVVAHAARAVLALGALGVVYGDIGTSPLYTEQVIFTAHSAAAKTTLAGVYGVVSLIFWALMIVVTIKYAGFIMRAHNRGDGGIMALTALIQRRKIARTAALVTLGIFGASLFFGDGMITPAISVLSAVEGLKVAAPAFAHLVLPISLVILRRAVRHPAPRNWRGRLAVRTGDPDLVHRASASSGGARSSSIPGVLQALSPTWGVRFMVDHGVAAFLTLGGVVLAVTGAETLYADRGHFGAGPIRFTWFWSCSRR